MTYLSTRVFVCVCRLNIKSIINMQLPGEHAHCGPDLDPNSGFTYSPQIFIENQSQSFIHTLFPIMFYVLYLMRSSSCSVYFYNFGMTDFGVSSLEGILNAVKVLSFSVQEGKVAVHCHAGLGRTGKR